MNIHSRFWGARVLVTLAMLFGLQHMLTGGVPTANAAPSDDVAATVQDVASGDLSGILQLLGLSLSPTPAASLMTPAKATVEAKAIDPTMPVVQYVGGTGNGQAQPNIVQDGVQYVTAPYAASIFGGMMTPLGWLNVPAPWGPLSYGDSTVQGARQAVANAASDSTPDYRGFSQGESAAWIASATDGKESHLTGYGSPTNPGTGFVSSMPNNLLLTQIGNPPALQPGDTADLYSATGDCWTNLPPLWSILSWPACIPSTLKEHYGNTYNEFREDETYESAPGITQHVMNTENGYVIAAEDWLHLDLTEDQKQFLRTVAPQGQPGIQQGPTLREIVEDPAAAVASTVDALVKTVPAVIGTTPQADSIPQAKEIPLVTDAAPQDQFQAYVDQGTQMIEDFANGTGNPDVAAFVDNTVNTVNQVVDSFTAPAVTAPVQDAAPAPAFTAPVGDLGDLGQQITNTVNQFTGGNTGIDLGAIANGLFAGAH